MGDHGIVPIRRALISVSDKTGIVELAKRLVAVRAEILSTGGTAALLTDHQLPVTEVSGYTGFPEIMDGRVKTLHPAIHGGILGRRGIDEAVMQRHAISPIDLVVVNLYPFTETVSKPGCDLPTAIEQIDVGGPTMVRAAAKNHAFVTVLVDSGDYPTIVEELDRHGGVTAATRLRLAHKAFAHTAAYDGAIAGYLSQVTADSADPLFPELLNLQFHRIDIMRYGENPHQRAAFYAESGGTGCPSLVRARQLQGKAMSYNNVMDADAALECVCCFEDTACVIVKHANPCGVAVGKTLIEAYDRAFRTDPTSAFGGIIAFNRPLDAATAADIVARQFVEVIVVPQVESGAREVLAAKKNVRVMEVGPLTSDGAPGLSYRRVVGGLLVQEHDRGSTSAEQLRVMTERRPTDDELRDLLFAWRVVKFVKSNAIVYARELTTVGIGAGQMSRVYSAKIAGLKAGDAGLEITGSVMASDAFFPFQDSIDAAAEAGITAVIEPGGSMRDEEVITAADKYDMSVVFTGMRHFRH